MLAWIQTISYRNHSVYSKMYKRLIFLMDDDIYEYKNLPGNYHVAHSLYHDDDTYKYKNHKETSDLIS